MTATTSIPLGRTMMTRGVSALIDEQPQIARFLPTWLARHALNDCPDLSEHDRQANAWAIEHDERVLTSWLVDLPDGQGKVWIITEWDRSLTTVLLPSEY